MCYSQYMQKSMLVRLVVVGLLAATVLLSVLFFLFHRGDNAPTVGFPVRMSVGNTPGHATFTISILVENTSGLPQQAHIVQPLPDGVTVKAAAGGKLRDNKLVWDVFMLPNTPPPVYQVEVAPKLSASPSGSIPGTQVTFSLPLVGFLINSKFTADDEALPSLKTVEFDGGVAPESVRAGSMLSLPVSITNKSTTTPTASTIRIKIEDLSGIVFQTAEQEVTLQPGEHRRLTVSLPAPSEPGAYIVTEQATGSTYVPSDLFEVTSR